MSKKEQAVARRLFHSARALGVVLDQGGPVPMSPAALHYEGGTIVYHVPQGSSEQLCVAPELSRPGAVRDAKSTCFEAAMCVRAHIEGADALERLLLDVGPEEDREAAWEEWLQDTSRAVPPPPKADYVGLDAAHELLRSWTQREPKDRRMKSDGWHALAKAVLKDAPEATQAPSPLETRRLPPFLLRGALLAVGGVALGFLIGMLVTRRVPAPPPGPDAGFHSALVAPYTVVLEWADPKGKGTREVTAHSTHLWIPLDEIAVDENAAEDKKKFLSSLKKLTVSIKDRQVPMLPVLLPRKGGRGEGKANPSLPGPPLIDGAWKQQKRTHWVTDCAPLAYAKDHERDASWTSESINVDMESFPDFMQIGPCRIAAGLALYRLAGTKGDLGKKGDHQLIVARILLKDGRTIDLTVEK